MPKPTSLIRVRKDLPTLLDDLVRREDIPGTGKMPKELEDLIRSNYLYLHTRGKTAPKLDLQSIIAEKDLSAWRIPLGTNIRRSSGSNLGANHRGRYQGETRRRPLAGIPPAGLGNPYLSPPASHTPARSFLAAPERQGGRPRLRDRQR